MSSSSSRIPKKATFDLDINETVVVDDQPSPGNPSLPLTPESSYSTASYASSIGPITPSPTYHSFQDEETKDDDTPFSTPSAPATMTVPLPPSPEAEVTEDLSLVPATPFQLNSALTNSTLEPLFPTIENNSPAVTPEVSCLSLHLTIQSNKKAYEWTIAVKADTAPFVSVSDVVDGVNRVVFEPLAPAERLALSVFEAREVGRRFKARSAAALGRREGNLTQARVDMFDGGLVLGLEESLAEGGEVVLAVRVQQ